MCPVVGACTDAGPSLELTESRKGLLLGQDTGHPGSVVSPPSSRGHQTASTRLAAEAAPECLEQRGSGHGHRGLRAVISVPGPVAKVEEMPTVTAGERIDGVGCVASSPAERHGLRLCVHGGAGRGRARRNKPWRGWEAQLAELVSWCDRDEESRWGCTQSQVPSQRATWSMGHDAKRGSRD